MHVISNVRKHITSNGLSELNMRASYDALQELWAKKQQLISEMNLAKKEAAEEAARPFLKEINEIDESYSAIIALVSAS